jgi:hypothetical protein
MVSNAVVEVTRNSVTIGMRVEIRSLYLHTWSRGFQVAGIVNDAYVIRRVSDGSVLPRSFSPNDIRPCS